jgi:hypothetical protein
MLPVGASSVPVSPTLGSMMIDSGVSSEVIVGHVSSPGTAPGIGPRTRPRVASHAPSGAADGDPKADAVRGSFLVAAPGPP